MDDFLKGDSGAVYIVLYLLPGFLGMAIYDYLVEGQPREVFDKIVSSGTRHGGRSTTTAFRHRLMCKGPEFISPTSAQ